MPKVQWRVCSGPCGERKPLTPKHFYRCTKNPEGFRRRCKVCVSAAHREQRANRTQAQLDRVRALHRAAERRRRARNPEGTRAQSRAWKERRKRNADAMRAEHERRRMLYRLQAEQRGETVRTQVDLTEGPTPWEQFPALPCRPLAEKINAVVKRENRALFIGEPFTDPSEMVGASGVVCEQVGIVDRTLRAWLNGEREMVQFDKADKVLTRADWFYWDVWNEDTVRIPALRVVTYQPQGLPANVERTIDGDCGPFTIRYRAPTRTGARDFGDLGPDREMLAKVERAFTGEGVELEPEQLTLDEQEVPAERRRWPRYALADGSPAAASIEEYRRRKPKRSPTGPAQERKRAAA